MNWQTINKWLAWSAIGRVRNSFISKALTAFSLATFVLAYAAPKLEEAGMDMQSAHHVFFGGIVFLLGYVAYAVFAPIEFRRAGEIDEIVGRMAGLGNWRFFQSRLGLAEKLLLLEQQRHFCPPPPEALVFLQQEALRCRSIKETDPWENSSYGLYHADLYLRQFARPLLRGLVAAFLVFGTLLVLTPTFKNIGLALLNF